MRYTHILFDADGTLFDFPAAERSALTASLAAHGFDCTGDRLKTYSRLNQLLWERLERGEIAQRELQTLRFRQFFDAEGIGCCDPDDFNSEYLGHLAEGSRLLPGAEGVCKTLSRTRTLALVTNGISCVQRGRLAASPVADCFTGVFVSDELGVAKPDAGYFDAVCSALELNDRSRALIVGDSPSSDIRGGLNAGIDTCLFDPSRSRGECGAKYVISALTELYDII